MSVDERGMVASTVYRKGDNREKMTASRWQITRLKTRGEARCINISAEWGFQLKWRVTATGSLVLVVDV